MSDQIPLSLSRRTVLRALTIGSLGAPLVPFVQDLRAGMSGLEVHELQIRVAGWATDAAARQKFLPINGFFDAATEAALRRFQAAYGLPVDGVAGAATQDRLAALAKADGSTTNFEWAQFASPDGSGFAGGSADEATVRERVRRLMYKLEALRHKLDGRAVDVRNGFIGVQHRARLRGATGTMHTHGGAADITVQGLTTYAVHRAAQTCGFSGLGPVTQSWLHCDSRAELA